MPSPTSSEEEFWSLRKPLNFKLLRSSIDCHYKSLLEELKEQGGITDECLDKIGESIKGVGESVEVLISTCNNIENRIRNSKVYNLWDKIYPIGQCDPHDVHGSGFKVPPNFPNNLTDFWRLKADC